MIRTAPEGRWFIAGAWAIALVLIVLAARSGATGWWIAAALWTVLAIWVIAFFRDPERAWVVDERMIVAPADGKVVSVLETDEPVFHGGRALRISIFMNVFSVHVNRYPVGGQVTHVHYNPGKFLNAAADKASLENEQSSVGIETGRHKVLFRQIAGLIARRIVTYSRTGDTAVQGERMGLIRFGSRVDVFVQYEPTPAWNVRLFANNLTDRDAVRERVIYDGLRSTSALRYIETRTLAIGPYYGVAVRWMFGG